jgi:2-polyprenyl-3-methyl-5-hydroxy-6-metoxy-1,4-benzoquinol methylase
MEARKFEEIEFHNRLRDEALKNDPKAFRSMTANRKYYAVAGASMNYYKDWLRAHGRDKVVLDFGCGDGLYSMFLAHAGAREVHGIDISDISVENCRRQAAREGIAGKTTFQVMDCEALTYADETFDIVSEAGVLHHLALEPAIAEMARVVKRNGHVICYEAVGHNPLFQLYRNLTPGLRTRYETDHILRMSDLQMMRRYFNKIEIRFFHLAVLLGVPFRKMPGFGVLHRALEALDRVLLRIPGLRTQAWMMVFVLSEPKRTSSVASGRAPVATA